jgi:vacuolar-type H+-ATPase subunit H
MTTPKTSSELSPLDQIRQTESQVTRQVAAARVAAEKTVVDTKREVRSLLEAARKTGADRGQARCKEIISQAEEEARGIQAQAKNKTAELRRKGKNRMAMAVEYAVSLVIGLEERGNPE